MKSAEGSLITVNGQNLSFTSHPDSYLYITHVIHTYIHTFIHKWEHITLVSDTIDGYCKLQQWEKYALKTK